VRLPRGNEAGCDIDTVVQQPDVLVVCDPSKLDRAGVRGAPDLVVEVVSPGTAAHDQQRKRQVYERAGTREYWLV
jgi:Uma2 family endonuclease